MAKGNEKKITLKDVAEMAGTSLVTVSRVLNKKPGSFPVSEATRQKVVHCAGKLQYRPNAIARAMRMNKTGIIGFVYSRSVASHFGDDSYYMGVQGGAEDYLALNGLNLLTCVLDDPEKGNSQVPNSILEGLVDGVIVFEHADLQLLERLDDMNIPTIAVNCSLSVNHNFVIHDNADAAMQLIGHLHGFGHRNICVVSVSEKVFCCHIRAQSLLKEARRRDFSGIYSIQANSYSEEAGEMAVKLLQEHPEITCFSCTTDGLAISVIAGLKKAGILVPRDISVTGSGGHNYWLLRYCDLATVRFDAVELGRMAVQNLKAIIENNSQFKIHKLQKGELSVGHTVAEANNR